MQTLYENRASAAAPARAAGDAAAGARAAAVRLLLGLMDDACEKPERPSNYFKYTYIYM